MRLLLKCNNVITGFDRRHTLTDRFYDPGALVSEDDGECALRILP